MVTGKEILDAIEEARSKIPNFEKSWNKIIITDILSGMHEIIDGDDKYLFIDRACFVRLKYYSKKYFSAVDENEMFYGINSFMGVAVVEDDELAREILMKVFKIDLSWPPIYRPKGWWKK